VTILLLTTVLPGEGSTGGESASRAFIEALRAAGHRVVVLGYRREGSGLEPGPDDWLVGSRPIETRSAGIRPIGWLGAALLLGLPYSLAKYRSRPYRKSVRVGLARLSPSLVVVDHAQAACAIPARGFEVPVAYLAHNVEYRLYEDAAARARGPIRWINRREARRILEVERRLAAGAARVWALSSADAIELERLGAKKPPLVFALPATVAEAPQEPFEHDVAMLGTWSWSANAVGLRWFVEKVHGLLPPATTVAVGGLGAAEVVGDRSGITCLGRVPDAGDFLSKARVIVVPAVAGAGVQVKTLDAIATGRPTVATPLAMRGIDDPPPTVRVAEDPRKMAAAVTQMLASPPGPEETQAARRWAERRRGAFRSAVAEAVTAR